MLANAQAPASSQPQLMPPLACTRPSEVGPNLAPGEKLLEPTQLVAAHPNLFYLLTERQVHAQPAETRIQVRKTGDYRHFLDSSGRIIRRNITGDGPARDDEIWGTHPFTQINDDHRAEITLHSFQRPHDASTGVGIVGDGDGRYFAFMTVELDVLKPHLHLHRVWAVDFGPLKDPQFISYSTWNQQQAFAPTLVDEVVFPAPSSALPGEFRLTGVSMADGVLTWSTMRRESQRHPYVHTLRACHYDESRRTETGYCFRNAQISAGGDDTRRMNYDPERSFEVFANFGNTAWGTRTSNSENNVYSVWADLYGLRVQWRGRSDSRVFQHAIESQALTREIGDSQGPALLYSRSWQDGAEPQIQYSAEISLLATQGNHQDAFAGVLNFPVFEALNEAQEVVFRTPRFDRRAMDPEPYAPWIAATQVIRSEQLTSPILLRDLRPILEGKRLGMSDEDIRNYDREILVNDESSKSVLAFSISRQQLATVTMDVYTQRLRIESRYCSRLLSLRK